MRVHKCLAFFLSELTKMENLKNFLLKIETKRMRIALIIQRLLMGAKKRRCMSMSKKRLLSIVVSAVILLSFACTAMAAEKSERYVGDSTVNGSIYQTYYQVDAQTRTGVKKISVSGVLYEKGTIGTWQKVSSCSNSSTTSTCMVSSSFNTKPGKSYRLEYSATFSYSDVMWPWCDYQRNRYVEQSYRLGNQNDYGHRRSCGDYFGISYFKKFLPDYQDTWRNRQ